MHTKIRISDNEENMPLELTITVNNVNELICLWGIFNYRDHDRIDKLKQKFPKYDPTTVMDLPLVWATINSALKQIENR